MHVEFGGGHKVIAAADHGTGRHAGSDMDSGKVIHIIHHAGGDHRARAAGTFFRRLENQLDDAVS
jgi:hypothetical protein